MARHAAPRSSTGRRLALGGVLATAGLLALPGSAFAGDYPCPEQPSTPTTDTPVSEPDTSCDPLLTVTGALDATVCLDLDASAAGQTVSVS